MSSSMMALCLGARGVGGVDLLRERLDFVCVERLVVVDVVEVAVSEDGHHVRHREHLHQHRILCVVETGVFQERGEARHHARSLGVDRGRVDTLDEVYFPAVGRDGEGLAVLLQHVAHYVRFASLALAVGSDGGKFLLGGSHAAQLAALLHQLWKALGVVLGLVGLDPL